MLSAAKDPKKTVGYAKLNKILKFSKGLNHAIIVADTREKDLFPYMNMQKIPSDDNNADEESKASDGGDGGGIPVYSVQLTVGDFAIIYKGQILAIVERKSWADMAASLRDGRSKNITKLRKARTELRARIYYLLEGRRPARNSLVGRVPMKAITSHLRHIQGHSDGVGMLFSRNLEDTSLELQDLAASMLTLKSGEFGAPLEDDESAAVGGDPAAIMMTPMEKTPDHIGMLSAVRGIAAHSATALFDMGITLPALHRALHKTPADTTPEIWQKVLSARHKDGKRVISQHKVVRKAIANLSNGGKKMPARILTAVSGISQKSAKALCEMFKLGDIIRNPSLLDNPKKLPITKKAKETLQTLFVVPGEDKKEE